MQGLDRSYRGALPDHDEKGRERPDQQGHQKPAEPRAILLRGEAGVDEGENDPSSAVDRPSALVHPLSVTDPLRRVARATFDPTGNRLTATSPTGRKQTWTDNANGTPPTSLDARLKKIAYVCNTAGMLSKTTDPVGRTQSTVYSLTSIPTSSTDGLGKVTSMTTDPAGRVLTVTDPNLHITASTWDFRGELASVIDANNRTTTTD